MNAALKPVALALARMAGCIAGVVPSGWRRRALFALMVLESRAGTSESALRRLFVIADDLDLVIDERATALGRGEHPKHRLTRYADFFIAHVGERDRVLDIGCGRGIVARAIARVRPSATIVGIDIDAANIAFALRADNPANLSFIQGDATTSLPDGRFDVVVLSNVLEHLDDRPGFLKRVVGASAADRVLIRVPLFERDWRLPMRRELGVNYFSDPDHRIEHTEREFEAEIAAAGLVVVDQRLAWGEIWAHCRRAAG